MKQIFSAQTSGSSCHLLTSALMQQLWLEIYEHTDLSTSPEITGQFSVNRARLLVYALVAIVGATMDLGLMWSIAETFNGLMAIPNLIAVFLLSGVVVKLVKEYFAGEGAKSSHARKPFSCGIRRCHGIPSDSSVR